MNLSTPPAVAIPRSPEAAYQDFLREHAERERERRETRERQALAELGNGGGR
jgi:hypothetical protein